MATIEDLVHTYLKLRDKKSEMENRHKMELEPIKEAMKKIEGLFAQALEDLKVQSFKTEYGTPYRSKIMNVSITDMESFLDFANPYGLELLDIRPSKSNIQNLIEKKGNEKLIIPGLKIEYRYNINVRRS